MANPDRLGRLKRVSKFIGFKDGIAGYIGAAGVGVSTGVGDAPEAEAGSLSAVGLHMDAGDEHDWFIPIWRDLNPLHPIGFRVLYSSASATGADTRLWIVLYDVIEEDNALALGTTALDTAIASDTDNGVANAWQYSPRGTLNGGTITEAQVTAEAILAVNLELDSDDASEEMNMYGLMVDYVPKRYQGPAHHYNPALTDE